jgi:hypothetical protein
MEKSEIRIGNYVYHKKRIVKIIELNLGFCTICTEEGDVIPLVEYKEIEPIPITEEFIKKNNIKDDKNTFIATMDINHFHIIKIIKYVHEVQNILKAFSLDKELIIG